MLKKLLITTAVSGLMLSTALAQYSAPSGSNPNAAQSGSSTSDSMKSGASGSSGAASSSASSSTSGASSGMFVSSQKADELLASKFKGTDVVGADNQKIGDVSDILFTKDGKIDAYIISVGGFLGVGSKEVALAPSAAQWIADEKDKDSFKLKLNLNKDQLAQAPNFEQHKAQRTTTGAATGSGTSSMAPRNAPANSMAPGSNAPATR